MIVLEAHAKLNLTLEVLGKRDDGYHETASIMQTLDLVDTVTLEPSGRLELSCSRAEIEGENNLALKAARLLRKESGTSLGASIDIEKRIPVASGLGGGSADAAATLVGLNRMWELGLSNDELKRLASNWGRTFRSWWKAGRRSRWDGESVSGHCLRLTCRGSSSRFPYPT